MQFLSDMLNVVIERPQINETTALGVAYLAGLQAGVFENIEQVAKLWNQQAQFKVKMKSSERDHLYQGWLKAIAKVSHEG